MRRRLKLTVGSRIERFEVTIVGGGIIGLATAHAVLSRRPRTRLLLLEKEPRLAMHQSGHNSGVLHSGIYYRPGSLKARLAVAGRRSMERFCTEHGVAFDQCGKVVVATRESELRRLGELERRGRTNGVRLARITPARLRELEPHVRGLAAIHVLDTGVVDFAEVCHVLARLSFEQGADIRTSHEVIALHPNAIETDHGTVATDLVVNCAGLHSDDLAQSVDVRIVPFRGEFHELPASRTHLVRTLVYPVPDPAFPFLGAHLTRGIHGTVHAGPNAVLALAREGYTWGTADVAHLRSLLAFPGFRVLVRRYWRTGTREMAQSLSRRLLTRELRRLVPEMTIDDLRPGPAGVRAQALDRQGNLLDDFVINETECAVHVVNAPSPAATASLEIGRAIAAIACARLP